MSDPRSPRDWLLARHASAQRDLDALRRATLPVAPENITWREFLVRVFGPHRVAWQTLATVWVVLAVLHFAQQSAPHPSRHATASTEAFAAWLSQSKSREILAQINRRP